ncbi:hypothetical protein AB9F29_20695 [Falsihalocynthiibacter sp. S25ZX9]|uniref:hypothetical protein n=1 Tax=Falsihalocynthiibacter sp. S25ZX9 TaxID=3240870 RepID=UPI00350E99E0
MAVAVDQMCDRLVGDLAEIVFEPTCRLGVDGINDNDSVICNGYECKMTVVLKSVDIPNDICDRAARVLSNRSSSGKNCGNGEN